MRKQDPEVPQKLDSPLSRGVVLVEHVLCDGCGYDLFGLPLDGVCPECGCGVDASRKAHRQKGGPLFDAKRDWVCGLNAAVMSLLLALMTGVAVSVCTFNDGRLDGLKSPWQWLHLISWILCAYAVWRLGVPERPHDDFAEGWRRWWPMGGIALPLLGIAILSTSNDGDAMAQLMSRLLPWGSLLSAAATLWVFDRLAEGASRIPHSTLSAQCRIVGWGVTALSVGVTGVLFWESRTLVGQEAVLVLPGVVTDHAGLIAPFAGTLKVFVTLRVFPVWQLSVCFAEAGFLLWEMALLVRLNVAFRRAAFRRGVA